MIDFFFGPVFRKNLDTIIRNKNFLALLSIGFVVFVVLASLDFFSGVPLENYHGVSRVFYPDEYTRKLVFFEVVSVLFILPFLSVMPYCLNSSQSGDLLLLLSGYGKLRVVTQRITPFFLLIIVYLSPLFLCLLFSSYINKDTTIYPLFLSQVVIGVFILFFLCAGYFLSSVFKSAFIGLIVSCLLLLMMVLDIFLIGFFVPRLSNPDSVINLALLFNPFILVSSVLNYDIMRSGFLYHTTQVVLFRFDYPAIKTFLCVFPSLSLLLAVISSFVFSLKQKEHKLLGRENQLDKSGQPMFIEGSVYLCKDNTFDSSIFLQLVKSYLYNKYSKIKLNRVLLRKTGVLFFPNDEMSKWQTPYSYLAYYVNLYKLGSKTIAALAESYGLGGIIYKKAQVLNGSERKLFSIFRSILHLPEIVFFDEPIVYLDDNEKKIFYDIITALKQEKKIIVIFTKSPYELFNKNVVDYIIDVIKPNGFHVLSRRDIMK